MNLYQYMARHGLNRTQLAKKVGIHKNYMGLLLNKKCRPSPKTACKISEATNGEVTPYDLRPDFFTPDLFPETEVPPAPFEPIAPEPVKLPPMPKNAVKPKRRKTKKQKEQDKEKREAVEKDKPTEKPHEQLEQQRSLFSDSVMDIIRKKVTDKEPISDDQKKKIEYSTKKDADVHCGYGSDYKFVSFTFTKCS